MLNITSSARAQCYLAVSTLLFVPELVFGQAPPPAHQAAVNQAAAFVQLLNKLILFPFVALLSGIALLVFIYGCFQYITNSENSSAREEGLKHITWGIIGLVVMIAAFAILNVVAGTFGLTNQLNCASNPTLPACTGGSNPFTI